MSFPYFDRDIGAHLGTEGATGARTIFTDVLNGIVAALIELFADLQKLLGASGGAEPAPLAIFTIDDDFAHAISPSEQVQSSEFKVHSVDLSPFVLFTMTSELILLEQWLYSEH